MKIHLIILCAFLAFQSTGQNNAPSKTFTEKLDGISTSSKELTKNASTDNSSVGQSGIMSTSVPLVTVSSRTMSFPIELQYGSGIKVDQNSGPVGLGWAMPIGSITRDYGAFQPDYSSTLHEGDMLDVSSSTVPQNGWLNTSGIGINPDYNSTFLGYDILPASQQPIPLSDYYHISVPGLGSNSFWNGGSIGGSHNWKLTEYENWRIQHDVKTYSIDQEYSRINELNRLDNSSGVFDNSGSFAAAIGMLPYVINGWASAYDASEVKKVTYEDFKEFIITDPNGTQYVFGRALRGQKFVFNDNPYWSTGTNLIGSSNAANGSFWKIDYIAEWLLTEIRTVDYVDVNNNGIADDGDAGDWIRFEYTNPTQSIHTVPKESSSDFLSTVPAHREWNSYSQTDQASSLMRERAYLTKIITPTQLVDFTISQRFDVEHDYYSKPANKKGTEFYYEDKKVGIANGSTSDFDIEYPVETMKYDSIKVYSKLIDKNLYPTENLMIQAVALNYAQKGSTQELAVSEYLIRNNDNNPKLKSDGSVLGTPSGTDFEIENYKNNTDKRGKTTLLSVDYFGDIIQDNEKTSYHFEYGYNPSFNEIHKREIVRKWSSPSVRQSGDYYPNTKASGNISYTELVMDQTGSNYTSINHTSLVAHEFLIDFPYEEKYYKVDFGGNNNNLNYFVEQGAILPLSYPVISEARTHPLSPVKDVFGFLFSTNYSKAAEAWSLTKIIYPTGGEVSFMYEKGSFEMQTDQANWSFDQTEIPIIKQYNELAKQRSYVQNAVNEYAVEHSSPGVGVNNAQKTLTATFEVPLPSNYGIRLESKVINDKINPSVTVRYEYNSGHFTGLPSEYVQSTVGAFNQFILREKYRHSWELGHYGPNLSLWTTDYETKMKFAAISGLSLDEYATTHFYEKIDQIYSDNSFVRTHYGPIESLLNVEYDNFNLFCYRLPRSEAGYDGGFILARTNLNLKPINSLIVEHFETGNNIPYKSISYTYTREKLLGYEFKVDYTGGLPDPNDPNDHYNQVEMWDNTFEVWAPISNLYTGNSINSGNVQYWVIYPNSSAYGFGYLADCVVPSSFYLPYQGVSTYSYERWASFKTTLKSTQSDYKGMVNSSKYFYHPTLFTLIKKEDNFPSLNKKHITTYEYAHETYSSLTTKFQDLNLMNVPTRTTSYLNSIDLSNVLSAQMSTYDVSSYDVPKSKNNFVFETSINQNTGTFTLVHFDINSTMNPNWRIDQNVNIEYNNNSNLILSKTNRLYNKTVFGNNLNLTKATFAYPENKFDATYSGFEDFHDLNSIADWNTLEYKNETWFADGIVSEPEIKLSISNDDICGNSSFWLFSAGTDFYHVVSIDDVTNVSVGSDIEIIFNTNGVTSVFSTKINSIVEKQVAMNDFGATSYTLDYVLCFSNEIDFPFTNPLNSGNEDPLLSSNSHTISCEIGSVNYSISKSYSRTGEYSYKLPTKRIDSESFNQTPIRPVKIYSIAEEGCLQEVPDDATAKSLIVPEHCKWKYEASVWLKYDSDLPGLKPTNNVVPKTLDPAGDARYIRGTISETDNGSQVKIICDVYNSSRSILIDQKIYYVEDLNAEWKQFTVDVSMLKQGEKWLDVYVVNERSQLGQPISSYKSVFVDDIAIYPQGAKYSYMTANKFGATTFAVDNNDVYVESIFDSKARPIAAINQYGNKTKVFEYFEHPNWTNQQNYITERNWVDDGLYNQSRYYIDGFGKTKQVMTADQTRSARIVSETNIFNNKGQVIRAYKPYVLKGSNFTAKFDNNYASKTLEFYGSNYAYVEAAYEQKPDEYLVSLTSPRLNSESLISKTQSEYLSNTSITNTFTNQVYGVGSLMVHQMIDEAGSIVRTYIDAMSRVIMEEHQIGQNHIQNADGSISPVVSPNVFAQTWFNYDDAGRLINVYDPEGKITAYTYNSLGVLIKSQSPDKGSAELRYDKYGQVRFIKNEKDIIATDNSIYNTDQFKYSKYDVWGRVVESGMIMAATNTAGLDPSNLPFPSGDFFNNNQKIDDQDFPLSTSKLVQVHAQFNYDGSREQFNSNHLLKEGSLSGHNLSTGYIYTPASVDKKEYQYMADGQLAKVEYYYQGLTGVHSIEPIYNNMRLPVGKTYTNSSQSNYNFTWKSELDNFGRVKVNSTAHNGISTQTGKYYYDLFGNLLMQGLGSTGSSVNPHIDYVVYKRNIRNQVVNEMTKKLRIGLSYDMVGNITNQYWSNEHFDPTTGATVNVNQYQYYYDKMNRLVGADFKTGSYAQNPFSYFNNISANMPYDFICAVDELEFKQILDPIFNELRDNINNRIKVDLSNGSINALNSLQEQYFAKNVSYPTMTEADKTMFLRNYIGSAITVGADPKYYEQYMAEKNQDQAHLTLLRSGVTDVSKLKYIKLLLQYISVTEYMECEPNASATVYAYLPNFQTPTTTTNVTKYDAAYWYSKNGNLNLLNRNDQTGVKTQQNYAYSNPSNNQLTGVTWTNINTSVSVNHLYQYDQTGNLLNDPRNGVTSIDYISYNDLPQGITNGSGLKTYRYDNNGQRIVKTNSASDIEFYIDNVIVASSGEVKSYQTNEGFAVPASAGGNTIEYFYNLKDWLGTNRIVLDATGAIQNASDHYPYGLSMPGRHMTSETEGDRYQFTGHEFDGETNYEYHGARYFNRELGRYMSVDPLASQFAGWSSYNYCFVNPIAYVDPDGKSPQDWIKEIMTGKFSWDPKVTSKENTPEGYMYYDEGSLVNAKIGDGPEDLVYLGNNEAHYLMPQTDQEPTLPNPFMLNMNLNGQYDKGRTSWMDYVSFTMNSQFETKQTLLDSGFGDKITMTYYGGTSEQIKSSKYGFVDINKTVSDNGEISTSAKIGIYEFGMSGVDINYSVDLFGHQIGMQFGPGVGLGEYSYFYQKNNGSSYSGTKVSLQPGGGIAVGAAFILTEVLTGGQASWLIPVLGF
jgi:RHS repeat-associated protein